MPKAWVTPPLTSASTINSPPVRGLGDMSASVAGQPPCLRRAGDAAQGPALGASSRFAGAPSPAPAPLAYFRGPRGRAGEASDLQATGAGHETCPLWGVWRNRDSIVMTRTIRRSQRETTTGPRA